MSPLYWIVFSIVVSNYIGTSTGSGNNEDLISEFSSEFPPENANVEKLKTMLKEPLGIVLQMFGDVGDFLTHFPADDNFASVAILVNALYQHKFILEYARLAVHQLLKTIFVGIFQPPAPPNVDINAPGDSILPLRLVNGRYVHVPPPGPVVESAPLPSIRGPGATADWFVSLSLILMTGTHTIEYVSTLSTILSTLDDASSELVNNSALRLPNSEGVQSLILRYSEHGRSPKKSLVRQNSGRSAIVGQPNDITKKMIASLDRNSLLISKVKEVFASEAEFMKYFCCHRYIGVAIKSFHDVIAAVWPLLRVGPREALQQMISDLFNQDSSPEKFHRLPALCIRRIVLLLALSEMFTNDIASDWGLVVSPLNNPNVSHYLYNLLTTLDANMLPSMEMALCIAGLGPAYRRFYFQRHPSVPVLKGFFRVLNQFLCLFTRDSPPPSTRFHDSPMVMITFSHIQIYLLELNGISTGHIMEQMVSYMVAHAEYCTNQVKNGLLPGARLGRLSDAVVELWILLQIAVPFRHHNDVAPNIRTELDELVDRVLKVLMDFIQTDTIIELMTFDYTTQQLFQFADGVDKCNSIFKDRFRQIVNQIDRFPDPQQSEIVDLPESSG